MLHLFEIYGKPELVRTIEFLHERFRFQILSTTRV